MKTTLGEMKKLGKKVFTLGSVTYEVVDWGSGRTATAEIVSATTELTEEQKSHPYAFPYDTVVAVSD